MNLSFENPPFLTRHEMISRLESNDPETIQRTLVSLVFHDRDFSYSWFTVMNYTRSSIASVRQVAYTCLGHIARLHQKIEPTSFEAAIIAGLSDENRFVQGSALNALEDASIYVKTLPSKLKTFIR